MKTKSLKTKKVIAYLQANPSAKPAEVAKKFKMAVQYVYTLRKHTKPLTKSSIKEEVMPKTVADRIKLLSAVKAYEEKLKEYTKPLTKSSIREEVVDKVNHPSHYKVGGIETIDFIEAKKLNYNLGNVIKYITRADHKGSRNEDLQKALWYLNRELGRKA
jgi:hypothetical protein